MASSSGDPLLLLRQSIASNTPPIPTIGDSTDVKTDNLAHATHLTFLTPSVTSFLLTTPTRFVSSDKPVDLRSIYFAWLNKDTPSEYIPAAQALNDVLGENGVQNLVFVERLDLITWLEGSSDDSEYIKPLDGAAASGAQTSGTSQLVGGAVVPSGGVGRTAKSGNPILQAIYNNERRLGDRNSVLRGIKPTDFSHVRKVAENYLKTARQMGKPGNTSANPAHPSNMALASHPKQGKQKRADPIILLSPSASSPLRMSNIKSFLGDGAYIPPDSSMASGDTNMVHITRIIPSIDPSRTQRFIIVDSPDQFKPEYWARVVAVFTTGQAWQFRSYKWQTPQDLFSHVLGVFIGTRGEQIPDSVKSWGRGVAALQIDPYLDDKSSRWRDREVTENVWSRIEEQMKRTGWTANGPGGRA